MTIEFAQILRMVVMRKEIRRSCFLSFISTLSMQLMNVDISHISYFLNCAETWLETTNLNTQTIQSYRWYDHVHLKIFHGISKEGLLQKISEYTKVESGSPFVSRCRLTFNSWEEWGRLFECHKGMVYELNELAKKDGKRVNVKDLNLSTEKLNNAQQMTC